MISASARLPTEAACVFLAPFFTLIPGGLGTACALSLVLLAWAFATQTTIEPAIYLLFLLTVLSGLGGNVANHASSSEREVSACALIFCVVIGVTMLISACTGRIRIRATLRFLGAGLARIFLPPGARGRIHAGWFALGLWLVFLVVALQFASYAHAGHLRGWLVAFLLMVAMRCCFPQWDPAALARVSLFVSPQPLIYFATPYKIHLSALAPLVVATMSVAVVWALHGRWTVWRLWNGRHPKWVLSEREGDRYILRNRVSVEGYRDSTQGTAIGSLCFSPSLAKEVKVALSFTLVFQVLNSLSWIT